MDRQIDSTQQDRRGEERTGPDRTRPTDRRNLAVRTDNKDAKAWKTIWKSKLSRDPGPGLCVFVCAPRL